MTEDMLEQQSEVLSKLGTTAEGAVLRARMQSACLLSDMEAFKVMNRANFYTLTIIFRLFYCRGLKHQWYIDWIVIIFKPNRVYMYC